jgi:hypothetical protein
MVNTKKKKMVNTRLFTFAMGCDQVSAIASDQTYIEKLQAKREKKAEKQAQEQQQNTTWNPNAQPGAPGGPPQELLSPNDPRYGNKGRLELELLSPNDPR